MVARAVPAGRWLAPLAVLVPILAAPIAALWSLGSATLLAPLVAVAGLAALVVGAHYTYGLRLSAVAAVVAWATAFLAWPFWYGITISTSLCGKTANGAWAWVPPSAGALAFLVVGSWALRSYRLTWGMALAVAVGFGVLLLFTAAVPGTQGLCET